MSGQKGRMKKKRRKGEAERGRRNSEARRRGKKRKKLARIKFLLCLLCSLLWENNETRFVHLTNICSRSENAQLRLS